MIIRKNIKLYRTLTGLFVLLLSLAVAMSCGGSGSPDTSDGSSEPSAKPASVVENTSPAAPASVAAAVDEMSKDMAKKAFGTIEESEKTQDKGVPAADFIADYIDDVEALLAKYAKTKVTISGVIEGKGLDYGTTSPYLDINGSVQSESHVIRCKMLQGQRAFVPIKRTKEARGQEEPDPTKHLSVGDEVTVIGTLKPLSMNQSGIDATKKEITIVPCELSGSE